MSNLLRETQHKLAETQHVPEDIIYIGARYSDYSCTWEEFVRLANVMYEDDYGSQIVACDLIIVFANGDIFERREYDGSEWWRVITPFTIPKEKRNIRTLFTQYSNDTLAEINDDYKL